MALAIFVLRRMRGVEKNFIRASRLSLRGLGQRVFDVGPSGVHVLPQKIA
jgi:hypothetical protein